MEGKGSDVKVKIVGNVDTWKEAEKQYGGSTPVINIPVKTPEKPVSPPPSPAKTDN